MDANGHEWTRMDTNVVARGGATTCHLEELCVTWNYHATWQMGEY